jgi:hypothetical protein
MSKSIVEIYVRAFKLKKKTKIELSDAYKEKFDEVKIQDVVILSTISPILILISNKKQRARAETKKKGTRGGLTLIIYINMKKYYKNYLYLYKNYQLFNILFLGSVKADSL